MVMSFDEMILKAKEFKMKSNKITEVITPSIKDLNNKNAKNEDVMLEFKSIIDKLVKVLLLEVVLKEESLSIISSIYNELSFNKSYTKGTIIIYEGNVYEILEDIISNEMYLPDTTPTQYARLNKLEEVVPVVEEPEVIVEPPENDPTNNILS